MKPVNLIPDAQRRHTPTGDGKAAYAVLGSLAVLLALTAIYVLSANQVTSRENDAAAASAEADQLEARAQQIGAFGDFAAIKEVRIASVRQLAEDRFDWERLMRELARVIPAGGWLQTAQASTTGEVDSPGGAPDSTGVGGPTAVLSGCLPRQTDVANLMLRLERMHRVEAVELHESTRAEEGAAPSLDSCGRFYQFNVTASFGVDQEHEAPEGARRVPASLGGGS